MIRWGWAGLAALLLLSLAGAYLAGLRCNLTPSLPVGLYRITEGLAHRGDLITFCLPGGDWARLAEERGYLAPGSCPSGLRPLLKRLAAMPGDRLTVTPHGIAVTSSGSTVFWPARVRDTDRMGRPLPKGDLRSGVIPPGLALAMSDHPGSFDSRFFGLVPLDAVTKVEAVCTFSPLEEKMDKDAIDALSATAAEAFIQAADGLAVPLDPDLADSLGVFEENALTLEDLEDVLDAAGEGDADEGK